MPAPTWVTPGTDLDFVRDKRPRDLRDLLKKGKPWTTLFVTWYASYVQGDRTALQRWADVVKAHQAGGGRTGGIPSQLRTDFDLLISLQFFGACADVRAWLEEQRDVARRTAPRGASSKQIREIRKANEARSIAEAKSADWEGDASGAVSEATLAALESLIAANTRAVTPKVAALLESYEKGYWEGREELLSRLKAAYTPTMSAQSRLRDACFEMRRALSPAGRVPDEKKSERRQEVLAQWTAYTEAYERFGEQLLASNKALVRWAVKDTAEKIEKNFAARHPGVAAAQFSINLTVTALSAVIQNLGLVAGAATLNPVVAASATALATGLTAVHDGVQRLTTSKIARADAENLDTVLEHVGMEYRHPAGGEVRAKVAEEADYLSNVVGQTIAPALEWAAANANSPAGTAAQLVPVAGLLWRVGGLAVMLDGLVNPKVLAKTRDREALHKLVTDAISNLKGPTLPTEMRVLRVDPASGVADVVVDGTPGILKNGRFHPESRLEALAEAVRSWRKARRGDVFVSFSATDGTITDLRRLTLLVGHDLATFETVQDGLTIMSEDDHAFWCSARASGLGLSRSVGRDLWNVEFKLSHEGRASSKNVRKTFSRLLLYSRDSSKAEIYTEHKESAGILLDIMKRDPGFDCLLAYQEIFELPDGRFTVDSGGVVSAPDGEPLISVADLEERGREALGFRQYFNDLLERMEEGEIVDIDNLNLPPRLPEAYARKLALWRRVFDHFYAAQASASSDTGTFEAIQHGLAELVFSSEWQHKYYKICEIHGLSDGYLRINSLVADALSVLTSLNRNEIPSADRLARLCRFSPDEWDWLNAAKNIPGLPDFPDFSKVRSSLLGARIDLLEDAVEKLQSGEIVKIPDFPDGIPPEYAQIVDYWKQVIGRVRHAEEALESERGRWALYESAQGSLAAYGDDFLKLIMSKQQLMDAMAEVATIFDNLGSAASARQDNKDIPDSLADELTQLTAEDWAEACTADDRFTAVRRVLLPPG
ncbi:hypothetical protein AB0D08_11320 [Kitasatospora sp. NPDC048540]|uniref:hypothetical protein n=1 Tax=Kitasatospora sp. NPDC048540 TaxID=3155634 RepID=UPI0033FC3BDA